MRVLRREMGVEPGPATLELFERILKAETGASRSRIWISVSLAAKPSQVRKVRALVGRTTEWQRLASAWQSAVEEGPRVAVISGEPGIGRPGLLTSYINRVSVMGMRPRAAGVTQARGRWPMRPWRSGCVPMRFARVGRASAAATGRTRAAGAGNP